MKVFQDGRGVFVEKVFDEFNIGGSCLQIHVICFIKFSDEEIED